MTPALVMAGGRSRWIPYAFAAFFGVVLLANGAMIWIAFATWTGLETESAYQKGLACNRTLERVEAHASLCWAVDLTFAKAGGQALAVEVDLVDRHGSLIEDASVRASFVRPTHAGHDLVTVIPHRYGGEYASEVELPLAGQWDVHVRVEADGEVWRGTRRVYIRP